MTTDDSLQSNNIEETDDTNDNNIDVHTRDLTSDNPSGPSTRRFRFFRSKRKQRLTDDQIQTDDDANEESNEPANTSETSSQSPEEISKEDISIKTNTTRRILSPPPLAHSENDIDETDSSSISDENQTSMTNDEVNFPKQEHSMTVNSIQSQPTSRSLLHPSSIYAGYQRKKSQSVKLTRIDLVDSYPKKNVRFADDFGLDLSQVKVIKTDELPHVPSAAFKDLHISSDDNQPSFYEERMKVITYLEQQFENPIHSYGFDDRVSRQKVVLEQANAIDNRIYGTVKLVSSSLNKRVKIHFTSNNWVTYSDQEATYIANSYDGTHDRFTFTLDIDRDRLCVGNNIQFCICYDACNGSQYWDNNYQQNYRFDCISRSIPDYSA